MNYKVLTIVLIMLMIPVAFADGIVRPSSSPSAQQAPNSEQIVLTELETRQLIIEENAKTRAEIKEYLERKTIDYNKNTQTMIDKNFQALDNRLDGMIRDAGFKVGVIWFSSIMLAGSLLLWINRKVNKKAIVQTHLGDSRFGERIVVSEGVPTQSMPEREKVPEKAPVKPKKAPEPVVQASSQVITDIDKMKIPDMGGLK